MVLKLSELADVTIGTTFNRVEATEHDDVTELKTISMQDVSYYCDKSDIKPEIQYNRISSNKLSSCMFTKKHDVILGMTSRNAMVIDDSCADYLLLSNFLCVRIRDLNTLNPNYLCLLLNENKKVQRIFEQSKQGIANVYVLKSQDLRDLEIPIIDIKKQTLLGNLYLKQLELRKVNKRVYKLNDLLINEQIERIIKENK